MAFTVASITGLKKYVLSLLNASSAYASTTDDDKFQDGQIGEALFQGDERIYTAIGETKGHYARAELLAFSADLTTYLTAVPSHIGELGEVQIKYVSTDSVYQLGKPMKREEIEIIRSDTDSIYSAANAASGTLAGGYYDPEALKDGVCAFTGYAMQIRVMAYTRTAALQCPEAYSSGIAAHALSYLFSVDGLDSQLALYYAREADNREALVRGNAKVLTDLPQMRKLAA